MLSTILFPAGPRYQIIFTHTFFLDVIKLVLGMTKNSYCDHLEERNKTQTFKTAQIEAHAKSSKLLGKKLSHS